jgi:hypothetical protein
MLTSIVETQNRINKNLDGDFKEALKLIFDFNADGVIQ